MTDAAARIPGAFAKSPANGGVVETVGIEPTWNSRHLPITTHGGQVRAYALVDADDFDRLVGFRWHCDNHRWGLIARKERGPDGKLIRRMLHREVLGLEPGDPRQVDHINRDTLDNRRANLRIVTTAQNAQNQGSRGGSSRFRGVTWDKSRGKWMATGMLDGRRRTIGRFDDEADAAFAAAEWRAEHMPFSEEAAA